VSSGSPRSRSALTAARSSRISPPEWAKRYYLLFQRDALTGVLQSFIMVEGSQYDSYSYLFRKPASSAWTPNAVPANIPLSGIRIAERYDCARRAVVLQGERHRRRSELHFSRASVLSEHRGGDCSDKGADSDMFFLSFDQLGSNLHLFVEPTISNPPMTADNTPRADWGIATFERVNRSMAAITGVRSRPTVRRYTTRRSNRCRPAPQIDAFLPAHQTASRSWPRPTAEQLVDTQSLRDHSSEPTPTLASPHRGGVLARPRRIPPTAASCSTR